MGLKASCESTIIWWKQPSYVDLVRPTDCVKPRFRTDLVEITGPLSLTSNFLNIFNFFASFYWKLSKIRYSVTFLRPIKSYRLWRKWAFISWIRLASVRFDDAHFPRTRSRPSSLFWEKAVSAASSNFLRTEIKPVT